MARNSLAAAKAELVALMTDNAALTDLVTAVYDHEPRPGDQLKGCGLTVSTGGMTPTDYVLLLRLYQSLDIGAKAGADNLDEAIMAVDGEVSNGFGPSDWSVVYDSELDALVAENRLFAVRQDYF